MGITLQLGQSLHVTPSLIGQMQVLQMDNLELYAYLEDLAQENPLIEPPEPLTEFARRLQWLGQGGRWQPVSGVDDERAGPAELPDRRGETLAQSVVGQLGELRAAPALIQAAQYLALLMDDDGLLPDTDQTLARLLGAEPRFAHSARTLLQSCDPAGVGAGSTAECLCLQLQRLGVREALCYQIVSGHLPDLAANRYEKLARVLRTDPEAVRAACDVIRSLNPKPGAGYAAAEGTAFVMPDVLIEVENGVPMVRASEEHTPRLVVNRQYLELLHAEDPAVRDYTRQKLEQLRQATRAVGARQSSTLRCAQVIVEKQTAFFTRGGELEPMGLAEVAQALDIHMSTVSRTVRGKYLECSRGVYAFRSFFSRNLDSVHSAHSAQTALAELIAAEDSQAPLTDGQLAERLLRRGYGISRRTVAKYRSQLGIQPAANRKQ